MVVYLLALALMVAGASTIVISTLSNLAGEGMISAYDARGYLIIAMMLVGFLTGGLAFFWGESRFGPVDGAEESYAAVWGLLFACSGCVAALGLGLARLNTHQRE
ncbi:MAG: hypothetical protein LAT65_14635 [Saccharospirillum sp.]|nr:hypothetical protein [Saccharospirillum sp.]